MRTPRSLKINTAVSTSPLLETHLGRNHPAPPFTFSAYLSLQQEHYCMYLALIQQPALDSGSWNPTATTAETNLHKALQWTSISHATSRAAHRPPFGPMLAQATSRKYPTNYQVHCRGHSDQSIPPTESTSGPPGGPQRPVSHHDALRSLHQGLRCCTATSTSTTSARPSSDNCFGPCARNQLSVGMCQATNFES